MGLLSFDNRKPIWILEEPCQLRLQGQSQLRMARHLLGLNMVSAGGRLRKRADGAHGPCPTGEQGTQSRTENPESWRNTLGEQDCASVKEPVIWTQLHFRIVRGQGLLGTSHSSDFLLSPPSLIGSVTAFTLWWSLHVGVGKWRVTQSSLFSFFLIGR